MQGVRIEYDGIAPLHGKRNRSICEMIPFRNFFEIGGTLVTGHAEISGRLEAARVFFRKESRNARLCIAVRKIQKTLQQVRRHIVEVPEPRRLPFPVIRAVAVEPLDPKVRSVDLPEA